MTETKIVVPTIDPVLAENFLKIQEKKHSGVSQSPNGSDHSSTPNATSQGSAQLSSSTPPVSVSNNIPNDVVAPVAVECNANNNNNKNNDVANVNANGNSPQPPSTVDLNPNDVLVVDGAKLPTVLEVENEDANRIEMEVNQFLQSCAAGYAYLGDSGIIGIYDPSSSCVNQYVCISPISSATARDSNTYSPNVSVNAPVDSPNTSRVVLLDLISQCKVDRDFELAARVYRNDIHNLNTNNNEAEPQLNPNPNLNPNLNPDVKQYARQEAWPAKPGHDQKQLPQKQNYYQNLNHHYEMVKLLPKVQRLVIAEYSDINFIAWYWNHSGLGTPENVFNHQFVQESWEQFDDSWYDPGKYRYWNRRFEDLKEQDRYQRVVNYKRPFYDYPYLPSDLEYAPPKILNRHICWDFNSPQLIGCTRPRTCRYLHRYVTGHSIKRAGEYYSGATSQYDGHLARYARWIEANLYYSYYVVGLDKDEIGKLHQMNVDRMKP